MAFFYGERTDQGKTRIGCKYAERCGDGSVGDFEVCIENYRGITEYTDSLVRVQTKGGQIRLTGRGLQIEYYTNDEMKVTGKIRTLEFIDGRNRE